MNMITTYLTSLFNKEDGQGLAEYALILAFIAVLVIGAVTLLGGSINTIMTSVAKAI